MSFPRGGRLPRGLAAVPLVSARGQQKRRSAPSAPRGPCRAAKTTHIWVAASFISREVEFRSPLVLGSPRVPVSVLGSGRPLLTGAGRPESLGSRSSGPPWQQPDGGCGPCGGSSGSSGGPRAPESRARGGARPRTAGGGAARPAGAPLQEVNQDDKEHQRHQGSSDCSQHHVPAKESPKVASGSSRKPSSIGNGHPAVAGGQVPRVLGQQDGQPQDGHHVPQHDASQAEEEVDEGHLGVEGRPGSAAWAQWRGDPRAPQVARPSWPWQKGAKSKACLGSCSLAKTGHPGGQIPTRCGMSVLDCPPPWKSGAQPGTLFSNRIRMTVWVQPSGLA